MSVDTQNDTVIAFEPISQQGPPSIEANTISISSEDERRNDNLTTAENNGIGLQVVDDEGDDLSKALEVEEALKLAHFHQATGFTLKYKCAPCCPRITVWPTDYTSMAVEGWKMDVQADAGCFCCFLPRAWGWQTLSLQQGDREVMNFLYRPQIWSCWPWGSGERIVDIYIPQRNERIGWIKCSDNFENGSIITDCVARKVFVASDFINHPTMGLRISDNLSVPMAICKATKGFYHRGFTTWTGFGIEYLPFAGRMTLSSKAVVLAALHVWVLMYRQKTARQRIGFILGGFIFGAIIGLLLIKFTN